MEEVYYLEETKIDSLLSGLLYALAAVTIDSVVKNCEHDLAKFPNTRNTLDLVPALPDMCRAICFNHL